MTTVGFLGLGSMGSGMAARLLSGGHDVLVWNRSKEPVAELVAQGAREAATAAEALAADVSFSMLANDKAVDEVLSPEALSSAAGKTHVNMASISPSFQATLTVRFADAGVAYAAACVLGRPPVASAGQLNILAAGPAAALEAAQPYFDLMGKRTWAFGETPSIANAVKASVNYNIIHVMQALGESIAMTERLGVEPELFVELLTTSLFGGVVYTGYGAEIVNQAYHPAGFAMALGFKDLGLAAEVTAQNGVTLATMPGLKQVFETALATPEYADADWGAIAEVTRRDLL